MKTEALDAAATGAAVAGTKSAATAVTTGLSTAVVSVMDGINWVTLIGVAVTILTFWMTWYFKNREDKRHMRKEEEERIEREHRSKERDIRISLMLAGQDPDKLPCSESQFDELRELPEAANG